MTLKEYCEMGAMVGMDDQTIIYNYIRDNHLEVWAIQTMAKLASDTVNDVQIKLNYARTWADTIDYKGLVKQYGAENAELLANWIEYIITHIEWEQHIGYMSPKAPNEIDWKTTTLQLQTLKDIVPTLNKPKGLFFAPALDALHQYGIYFKDEEKENEK